MFIKNLLHFVIVGLLVSTFAGCAPRAVREPVKIDMGVPAGKVEGNRFIGIRYPFTVSAPPGWNISTEYPKFMIDLGYDKEGLDESQVFLFNPATRSNVQIEFSPAARTAVFNQKIIEDLTTMATGGFTEELKKDYGKDVKVELSPTIPYSLRGVPYAAKKSAVYSVNGRTRDQGWIYGFAEPFQIFILYMILEGEGAHGAQDLRTILDSFQILPRETK